MIDADGHIIERTDELRQYLKSPFNKRGGPLTASEPWDRDLQRNLAARTKRLSARAAGGGLAAASWTITISSRRFFIRRRLGNVSRIREPDYAVALCEAYNDYVYDHYAKVSDRLKPIAIIPPQDPERAVMELRRAVKQLGYRGGGGAHDRTALAVGA